MIHIRQTKDNNSVALAKGLRGSSQPNPAKFAAY